jgi:hypothetical protein
VTDEELQAAKLAAIRWDAACIDLARLPDNAEVQELADQAAWQAADKVRELVSEVERLRAALDAADNNVSAVIRSARHTRNEVQQALGWTGDGVDSP